MSGLILCRTKEAKNPYYISNMDIKIYTLEELCYYIYENIYLISVDIANDKLIDFIRNEVEEKALADKLEYLTKQRAGLAEFVITILKYVDYYDISEIEQIREILEMLNTQNVLERLKARADRFLENKCYNSAIKNYGNILMSPRDKTLSGIFYASVNHNMGVAYSQLFQYKKAITYFDTAYSIGQHEESKKCSMAAKYLAMANEVIVEKEVDDYDNEEEYVLKREIETLMDNAIYSDEYKELEEIYALKDKGEVGQYYQEVERKLEQWKEQYSKYTT